MRKRDAEYVGVLSASEYEQILRECRRGNYEDLEWLEKYFSVHESERPEDNGTSWDELNRFRRAKIDAARAATDAD